MKKNYEESKIILQRIYQHSKGNILNTIKRIKEIKEKNDFDRLNR